MRLRGEVERDALSSIRVSIRDDRDATKMAQVFSAVNRCDTGAVRWGLWTTALADAFQAEEEALLGDVSNWDSETPPAERLTRLRAGALYEPDELARTEEALDSLGREPRLAFTSRLRACRFWYAEAALGPLSPIASTRLLALFVGRAPAFVDSSRPWHLDLLELVSHVREPSGEPRAYVVRLLETLLRAADTDALARGELRTTLEARALVSFPAHKGRESALVVRMEERDEARALLTLLPIYETKEAAAFHRTLKSLCDLYGLRKDDFDRVANEASYLRTMNAARSDKARLAELAKAGTIVEVGPGGGVVLDLLAERFPSSRVVGLDASRAVVEALEKRRAGESQRWEVREGDAFELPEIFGEGSLDSVVFCSVLHEIYSYVSWPREGGARFRLESVGAIVAAAFRALVPGGRILVRDGVMPPDRPRVLEFLDPGWRAGFELFASTYEPRRVPFETVGDRFVRLSERDLFEFVTTYTWGPAAFPYEIREQRAVLPRAEYVAYLLDVCSKCAPGFRAIEVSVPHDLRSYLSPGYPAGIEGKLRVLAEDGQTPGSLPDITGVWVLEKVAV
jgi:SAM-dependent methyltransferase